LSEQRAGRLPAGPSANMTDVSVDQLQRAVEGQHGGTAKLAYVSHVRELYGHELVWDGEVHVFDLEGHPEATRAYAWSRPIKGSNKRRFYAVLHLGTIHSAIDAVRAFIATERKAMER
jgi:hypothetical protein